MIPRLAWMAAGAIIAAGACLALPRLVRVLAPERKNYLGEPIATGGGLLLAAGAMPWLWATERAAACIAAAAVGFAVLGLIDDRWGTAEDRGVGGHARALRQGRVTTGVVKAAGGIVLAASVAWRLEPGPSVVAGALLIALLANTFNLLDLRPLRALKLFWLLALPLAWVAPPLLAQTVGSTVPYAYLEARRRVMLGDTGANLLGGLLGATFVLVLPVSAQAAAAALLALFHVWTEKHSLTRWIEARPWARTVDEWGRGRPLPIPAAPESGGR